MAVDKERRHLTFEFVVDSQLARNRDEFRFRVLLDDRDGQSRRAVAARQFETSDGIRGTVAIDWCRPLPIGLTPANVLAESGATTGTICAYGRAFDENGHFPSEVRGKIVTTTVGLGDDPPSDALPAEMVNGSGENVFPGSCNVKPNFIFRTGNGGEFIPGVKHSAAGVFNKLVIWIKVGAYWSRSSVHPFHGKTATSRDCDAVGEETLQIASLGHGTLGPDGESPKLRVVLGTPRGTLGTDVLLSRVKSADAKRVWNSCPVRDPSNDWKLWIETRGGTPYATLAVRKLFGTPLDSPLLWRSETWTSGGTNRLVFDSPAELLGNVPNYVDVRPA